MRLRRAAWSLVSGRTTMFAMAEVVSLTDQRWWISWPGLTQPTWYSNQAIQRIPVSSAVAAAAAAAF
jgi:hypothetical protein